MSKKSILFVFEEKLDFPPPKSIDFCDQWIGFDFAPPLVFADPITRGGKIIKKPDFQKKIACGGPEKTHF